MKTAIVTTTDQPEELPLSALERIELLANIIIEIIDEEQTKPQVTSHAGPISQ